MLYRRIRDMREDMDLSRREVAEALSVTQQAYSNYELGLRDIPTDTLIKMADFFHTTTDYILNRTNERKADCSHFSLLFHLRHI